MMKMCLSFLLLLERMLVPILLLSSHSPTHSLTHTLSLLHTYSSLTHPFTHSLSHFHILCLIIQGAHEYIEWVKGEHVQISLMLENSMVFPLHLSNITLWYVIDGFVYSYVLINVLSNVLYKWG